MIVTLMINNACNLRCQHCYLPGSLQNTLLPESVIEWVFESRQLDGVILVGMEPLMNTKVAKLSAAIGQRCERHSIPFSIITNGMNLAQSFAESVLRSVTRTGGVLDISLDGGPTTYDRRGGNYQRIVRGMQYALNRQPNLKICILNTIWRGWNTERVDDSVVILDAIPSIHRIQYSLYVNVDRVPDARHDVPSPMTARQAMTLLQTSSRFMKENRCVLVLDEYNARAEAVSLRQINQMAHDSNFPLRRKSKTQYTGHLVLAGDPIDNDGYLRIHPGTSGAIMLSPWDSLHTAKYSDYGVLCDTHQMFDDIAQQVSQSYWSRHPQST